MRKLVALVSVLAASGCTVKTLNTEVAATCADVRPHAAAADCLQAQLDAANRQLHLCYEGAVTKISKELASIDQGEQPGSHAALVNARNELQKAHSAWQSYRDEFCSSVESMWTTGSGAGNAELTCYIELTLEQVKLLKKHWHGCENLGWRLTTHWSRPA